MTLQAAVKPSFAKAGFFQDRESAEVQWPPGYEMRAEGLYYDPGSDKTRQLISGPFQVEAEGRTTDGSGWCLVLSWADRDGRQQRGFVDRADLAGDPRQACEQLADRGLSLIGGRGKRERFVEALAGVTCSRRVTIAKRTGWHARAFLMPHITVTPRGSEPVVFRGQAEGTHFGERGTLEDWKKVAVLARGCPVLTLCLSAAFVGPLLEPLGREGGGLHLYGPSSSGKTTALRLAGSVWGGGGERGFALTWRSTSNATEAVAARHNHTLLALDEIGEVNPHDLDAVTYMLAGGQPKGRMRADGGLRHQTPWRVFVLSTGEISAADRIREAGPGKRVRAGQEVRLVDVPAEAGQAHGLFEGVHSGEDAAALAREIREGTDHSYGTAGPAFVSALIEGGDSIVATIEELYAAIRAELVPPRASGQAIRVSETFALIAAAGEAAIQFGVLPLDPGAPTAAAKQAFKRWLETRGGAGRREDADALETLRAFLLRFGDSRIENLDDPLPGRRIINDRAGWLKEGEYLITTSGWKEIFKGQDWRSAAEAIGAGGFLRQGPDGWVPSIYIAGVGNRRVYRVSRAILEGVG